MLRLDLLGLSELQPRMFFLEREGHSTLNISEGLRKAVQHCKHVYVYVLVRAWRRRVKDGDNKQSVDLQLQI